MRYVVVALILLAAVAGLGGAKAALAADPSPRTFEEAGRLVDQVADQIRDVGARFQRYAQWGRGPAAGMMPGMPGMAMGPARAERPLLTIMLHHRADLGLTTEQVTQIETLRTEFAREAIRRTADARIAELDVQTLLGQDPVDMSKVEAKIREAAQIRVDLRLARLRTLEQGKAVLTAEQRTKLQGLVQSMPHHEMHHPGMHGPGMQQPGMHGPGMPGGGPGGPMGPRRPAGASVQL